MGFINLELNVHLQLDNPDRVAIAIFPHGRAFIVSLGNIPAEVAQAAAEWLHGAASGYLSDVSQYGSRPGSIASRRDVFVPVCGPEQRVLDFARERLECESHVMH